MSETSTRSGQLRHSPAGAATPAGEENQPGRRKRRGVRIALISVGSVFALVAAIAVAGLVTFNHIASEIKRVPVHFAKLTAYDHYAGPGAAGGTNVLLTSSVRQPAVRGGSDLITILHINANHQAGGVVAISPNVVAAVPGHGRLPLGEAQAVGGPSLLVSAVQALTGAKLSHYASLDFSHVANVVNTAGGVNVTLPAATTAGRYTFHAGVNHLNGAQVLAYTSRPGLSPQDHVLRQQVVLRAVLRKIANAFPDRARAQLPGPGGAEHQDQRQDVDRGEQGHAGGLRQAVPVDGHTGRGSLAETAAGRRPPACARPAALSGTR